MKCVSEGGSIVIGLHGAKGSGKDQFFKTVESAFRTPNVRKIAYADPIKFELMRIFKLDNEREYDELKRSTVCLDLLSEPLTVDGRHIVREIGMLMRRYDESQFVRYVEQTIKASRGTVWCVTDVRFSNEVNSIRNVLNGTIIKVVRPGYQYDGHATEQEVPDDRCDVVIINDGTRAQYEQKVCDVYQSLLNTVALQGVTV